jgi:hypothetical protein
VWLALIRLALGRVPFTALRRVTVGRPRDIVASLPDRGLIEEVVWAVTAVSRRVGRSTTCLTQALTVQALLARRGYPSRLHIGVTRGRQGELDGHAWVELDGRILIGGTVPQLVRFVPLTAFDSRATEPVSTSSLPARR